MSNVIQARADLRTAVESWTSARELIPAYRTGLANAKAALHAKMEEVNRTQSVVDEKVSYLAGLLLQDKSTAIHESIRAEFDIEQEGTE